MWWSKQVFIIALQILAFFPYIIGSKRFYEGRQKYIALLLCGVILDALIGLSPVIFKLERMTPGQTVPWSSWLFVIHIAASGIGMFGFIYTIGYVLIRGRFEIYPRLRIFQYKVLLPLWIFGVSIALINFAVKVIWNLRLYDYF